ncbi:hypothetical protein Neosp_010031 [[Neocosmospora] mangrovei]
MYRLLTFKASPQKTKWIGIILGSLFTIVMVTHMVMDEFLLHATTFGLGVYIIATRNLKLIPQQVPDPEVRRAVRNVALLGGAIGGYIGVAIVDLVTSGEVTEDPIDSFAWPIPFAARLVTGPTKSAKKA